MTFDDLTPEHKNAIRDFKDAIRSCAKESKAQLERERKSLGKLITVLSGSKTTLTTEETNKILW